MSNVDDMRKLFQDLITPDLKALEARFVALDQKFDLKFAATDQKIDGLDKRIDLKIDALEVKLDLTIEALDKKFESKIDFLDHKVDYKFDLLMSEIRNLAAVVASNHATILNALDINRRVEKIESEMAAKTN